MNYELAKQLKDAGFPQKRENRGFFIHHETGERPYEPTLAQLIEACGDRFDALRKEQDPDNEGIWVANADRGINHPKLYWGMGVRGSTAEEAVAKLWLALRGGV